MYLQHMSEVMPSLATAPLHPWQWPDKLWSHLHLDFVGPFLGKMDLVLVDAHSKWMEVVVHHLKQARTEENHWKFYSRSSIEIFDSISHNSSHYYRVPPTELLMVDICELVFDLLYPDMSQKVKSQQLK